MKPRARTVAGIGLGLIGIVVVRWLRKRPARSGVERPVGPPRPVTSPEPPDDQRDLFVRRWVRPLVLLAIGVAVAAFVVWPEAVANDDLPRPDGGILLFVEDSPERACSP